tara:strand:+ start:222 stop:377 length:156 start_codon:yes stop_codon:yes gene_type:complete
MIIFSPLDTLNFAKNNLAYIKSAHLDNVGEAKAAFSKALELGLDDAKAIGQ